MKNFTISKKYVNNDEEIEILQNSSNKSQKERKKTKLSFSYIFIISILLFIIISFFIFLYLKIYFKESKIITNLQYKSQTNFTSLNNSNNINISNNIEIEIPDKSIKYNENIENQTLLNKSQIIINDSFLINNYNNGKIGVAFVFECLYGNGIGRMLSLLCSELAKLEKYDIYMITGPSYKIDFPFDKRVIKVPIIKNKTLIEKYDKSSNIKIYVLQNDLAPSSIRWYQNLNGGKKVIGIVHGVYMSSIFANFTGVYSIWKNNLLYDAYIQVNADDYYVNKRLGINNSFFLPNLYTFDPDKTPNSNLTYNNLLIIGRELDRIKGGMYGVKAMDIVRREIPDAKLYMISANGKVKFLENLIQELNLTENIQIISLTKNISKYRNARNIVP